MENNQKKKSVNKKIIALLLVIMVLVNMVAPLIKFAGEPEETTVSTNTIEGTSTNQGEKPEGISNESENDTEETKQSEEPQTEKTTDENQTGENKKDEETKEESKETTTTEETKETNNSEEEKTTSSGDTPKVTAIKDYTAIIKVLESKIEPMEKKTVEVKEKNDEYEINSFVAQFVSGAKEDTNGNLVWTPSNSAEGHEFTFRVNYAISGLKELPAGAIQITIPKSILRNREGKLDDYFVMSLPKGEEYDGTTEFAYMEDEEYLVIYNPEEVAAGINGYFEVAYATNSETYEYKDYDKENTKTILEGGTASDPFYAIITVQAGEEETLATISDDEHVYINTTAKIVSTQKRYPSIYRSWNSSWMKETPEDSDEYYYLVWEIRTYIASNTTQRYNFSLNDVIKDLTKELEGTDYQLVGYKMSGEKYYSDKNTQENLENEGYRYDYVLTRHKIETYKDIEYQLKNTITAVVDPVDQVDDDTKATSSNTFSWNPEFTVPTGNFNLYKYGNNKNYDLDKFQSGEMEELDGFKYITATIGYAYPWTLKEGGSSDNPEDYGVNPVTYDTWDDSLYLEGDTEPMNTEDYYLDYLIYSITNKDAKYDEFFNKFVTISPNYEEGEEIIFYGKFKDSENWIEIGTYNLSTNKLTKNDEYVEEITTNKIVFKENVHCTGWRFTTTNKHYYTYITVTPYFVLTHSSYVDEKVENKDSIKIQNNVSTNITNYKGETIFEKETSAIDYARVTYYDSQITKKVSAVSNNVSARTNTITWKVNVWETATSGKGVAEYIKQDSGIFYDLIPLGGEIDLNSVQVQTNKGYLAENEYSYEVVANYKNSGRTLLIVRINEQAEYYTVYYNTVHSWDSIQDYGRNVLNPVAYETGNEKITHGYADNGGNLSEGNKSLFTNLDETTDDKKFIYAEQTYNINILTAAISGLYKKVKNAEETLYSYQTEVEPEGTYTYQLRYQNTFINQYKNLILFDSLENFVIVDSKTGTTESSGWRGTLKSVDLSQLTKRGIDAKLYVSTEENLDLEANNDITDTKIWKKANEDTDLSKVKAIAIDMTKGTDGEDYILGAGESVTAVLYMKAPAELTEEIEKNPYTYNNIYIQNTLIDILGGIQNFFIHQDYTKVKYHVIADVNFYKVNAEDLEETIKGITFRLYGTSKYGTEVDKYVTSDKNGYVNFKDIEAGEYILQEYAGTPDWVEDHTEHRVKITNTREVYIDEKLVTEEEPVTIENTPRIYTNITFTKRNLVTNGLIEGAKFKLSGTSKYGTETLMYAISTQDGTVLFEDLEYGTYEMIEVEVPEGYILNRDTYRVVVDENGNYDILQKNEETEKYETIYSKGKYNIYNEPLHSFRIVKRDNYSEKAIQGAKFKLFGISDYGNSYNKEIESTVAGFVDFTGLEPGTYILQETYVPEVTDKEGNVISYILDETQYPVEIKKDGTVTIDGIEQNENGNFEIYNKRNKGQITITKKWVDDSNNDERPEPTIYISTEKPTESKFQYFRNNYSWIYGPLYYVDSNYKTKITGTFARNTTLSESEVVALGAKRIDIEYDDPDAEYKIYGWIDSEGNFWWWSNAEVALMTDNSNLMFYDCNKLTELDLSNFDTSKVTNMDCMFRSCSSLTELDVSNFDTSNVTDMSYMFFSCSSLTELDLSNFDTSKVTNMDCMFRSCSNLKELDLSNFDTSHVTDMSYMFTECYNLTVLDLSNFDTSKVKYMNSMFDDCRSLTELDLSNFDTSKVTNMSSMFRGCSSLKELDLSNFDTSKVKYMNSMFDDCWSLTELDLSNFDTSKVTNMSSMFGSCSSLKELDLSNFDTSKVTNMSSMFRSCSSLKELDLSNLDTSKVTNMSTMFYNCNKLTELDVSNFDTSNVTDMSYMFLNCISLTELDLSNFDTSKVTNMSYMFSCDSLKELDLSNFDTSNVTDMSYMFLNCISLTELDLSNFDTSKVTNMSYMFLSCRSLTELDLSNFDTSKVTNMSYMFWACRSLTELDLSNFDTSKVTNMSYMFLACRSLTELDLSNFDTSKVTNMSYMFIDCGGLRIIYASAVFVTTNVTSSYGMFDSCNSLIGGNGTKYSSSYTDKTYARIDKEGQPGYFTYKASTVSFVNDEEKIVVAELNVLDKIKLIKSTEKVSLETNNFTSSIIETMNNMAIETANLYNETLTYSTADTNYDDQGNETKWVKNGDIWTYTFYVDDPNATWYIWEEDIEGYETNYTSYFPGTVENQKATVVNIKTDEDSDSNTSSDYEEPKVELGYGNLKITKKLIGNTELTKEDDNTEFTFTVTLTAKEGQESLISGIKAFGEYVFKDGVGTVKIRAGETATLSNIPAGVSCKITEEEILGYDCFSGASVTISKDRTTSITATNFKDMSVDEGEKEEKTTSFTVAKEVTGNYEVEKSFNFEISLNNLKPDTTYYLSNENSFTSDSDGNADVSVTLKNGESVTVKDIPVGSKYKVYEHAGEYISSYVITDANDVGLINNTADRNTKENIAISTKLETADEGEDITITFTNEKNVKQNLKLTKEVTDENDKNSYIFTIEFANMEEKTEFNSTVGKVTADSQGKAELTIYLAGGQEAEFYDIPVGTTYKITELASSAIASYKITDKNGTNQIVQQTGANGEAKLDLSTKKETINEGEEAIVTFINDTVNQEPDSVSVSLGITKNVLNIKGEVLEDCEETFTFEVKPENEENPMPENKEIKVKGNGTESFGTITFTKTGTYKYKITEKAGELDYYNYDDAEYEIVYEVTNQEGLLEVTKTIKKDGFINDVIIFTNQISKVDVKILKTDENRKELPGAKLQILDAEGNIVKEWTTEETEHTIKLAVGTYTLREKEAPEKYEKAEDIIFVVNKDGTISVKGEKVDIIVMEDAKIQEKPIDENIEKEQEKITEKTEETITGDDIISFFISLMIATIIFALTIKEYRTKE